MTQTTNRFEIPFPSRDEPWYQGFSTMINQVDAQLFALHEERNLITVGGGTVSWNGSALSWSGDITFISPTFNRRMTLASGAQAIALGEFWVATMVRGATTHVSLSSNARSTLDIDRLLKILAYRVGSDIHLWTGLKLEPGDAVDGLYAFGGSAPPSPGEELTIEAGTNLALGSLVAIDSDGKAAKADATVAGGVWDVVGVSKGIYLVGASATVYVGRGLIPMKFNAIPGVADNGDPVFLGPVNGEASLVPPAWGTGEAIFKTGILKGGDGISSTPLTLFQPQEIAL